MNAQQVRQAEKRIVAAAVKGLLAAGYHVGVDNGGDELEVRPTTDQRAILEGYSPATSSTSGPTP